MIAKFILFLLIIYGSLFLGYGLKKFCGSFSQFSKPITKIIMITLTPIVILNSFWSIEFKKGLLALIPLIHVTVISFSIVPAVLISNYLRLNKPEKGSFISCSLFSNVGLTLGGFLCFIFYGEQGLYLSSLYISLFIPYYYLVGFPFMSLYSKGKRLKLHEAFLELLRNPVSIVPISFMCTGLIMNFAGIPRPAALNYISARWLIYILSAGYSFAIGLGLNFRGSIKYIKHSLYITGIKFIFNPLMGLLLLFVLGFFRFTDPLPSRVIFIESFMPTAIMSVLLVKLFDLNEDLSNAVWILTNILVIPFIPLMWLIQNLF